MRGKGKIMKYIHKTYHTCIGWAGLGVLRKKALFLRVNIGGPILYLFPSFGGYLSLCVYKCIYNFYADIFRLYHLERIWMHQTLTHTYMYLLCTSIYLSIYLSISLSTYIIYIHTYVHNCIIYKDRGSYTGGVSYLPVGLTFESPGSGVRELPGLDQGQKSNETCFGKGDVGRKRSGRIQVPETVLTL